MKGKKRKVAVYGIGKNVYDHGKLPEKEYLPVPITVDISGKRRSITGEKVPVFTGRDGAVFAEAEIRKWAWKVRIAER